MLDGERIVWEWPFKQLLEVVQGTLCGLPTPLVVGGSHERALMSLHVLLLAGTVGGAFTGVFIPLRLAFEAVEDRSDHLLTRGVAGGDVEEALGGSRTRDS